MTNEDRLFMGRPMRLSGESDVDFLKRQKRCIEDARRSDLAAVVQKTEAEKLRDEIRKMGHEPVI